MMKPTNRNYKDVETGEIFRFYADDNHNNKLIAESGVNKNLAGGTEVNGWYLSANHSVHLKINNKKIIKLSSGEFYNLKEGERITHRKYPTFDKRFSKII